ncbi:ricin-type beta-trefoil lectin domain protein [Streptomyces hayashii]|uniref:ricin-type beta-trefoil lectin domain protein n=1 Tax=Streptomyces hayashii TaxID=2839966 RepID=UPI00403C914E
MTTSQPPQPRNSPDPTSGPAEGTGAVAARTAEAGEPAAGAGAGVTAALPEAGTTTQSAPGPAGPPEVPRAEEAPAVAAASRTEQVREAEDGEEAEAAGEARAVTAEPAPAAPVGRPHRTMLAGAAFAGALLLAIPFLVGGGEQEDRAAGSGWTPGTVLGSPVGEDGYGAIGSASPTTGARPPATGADGRAPAPDGAGRPGTYAQDAQDAQDAQYGTSGTGAGSGKQGTTSGRTTAGPSGAGASRTPQAPSPTPHRTSPGSASKGSSSQQSSGGSTAVAGRSVHGYASGRCIDVTGSGGDGTPLQIWDCTGASQQTWRFMSDGTVRSLGLCMDVAWGSTRNGAVIQLARCSGNPAQQFRLNAAHDLVNPQADKCVDVKDQGTGNGTRLQLWDCNGRGNQKWG